MPFHLHHSNRLTRENPVNCNAGPDIFQFHDNNGPAKPDRTQVPCSNGLRPEDKRITRSLVPYKLDYFHDRCVCESGTQAVREEVEGLHE